MEEPERQRWRQRGIYALIVIACSVIFGLGLLVFGYLDRAPSTTTPNPIDSTWKATNLIAVFDLLMVAATVVGIALLYSTLKATRETLREATRTAEAAERAERAYLIVSDIDLSIDGKSVCVFVGLTNYGRTPARAIQATVDVRLDGPSESWRRPFEIAPSLASNIASVCAKGVRVVAVPEADVCFPDDIGAERYSVLVVCSFSYDTMFSNGEKLSRSRDISVHLFGDSNVSTFYLEVSSSMVRIIGNDRDDWNSVISRSPPASSSSE